MQGNCTADPSTFTDRAAAELKRLFGALTGDPVPLKPFQCLLLTNANTLFLNDGNGFWLDNLYVGVTQLRSQQSSLAAAVLSAGNRAGVPYNWDSFTKPMNIFLTNITVHGHDEAFSTRIVALTPAISQTSLLFQGTHCPPPPLRCNLSISRIDNRCRPMLAWQITVCGGTFSVACERPWLPCIHFSEPNAVGFCFNTTRLVRSLGLCCGRPAVLRCAPVECHARLGLA